MSTELQHANQDVMFLQFLERAASDPAVDVAKMKAILDMQERVLNRNAGAAFNAAMTKAQAAMPIVVCDKTNPHTQSKYPSLEAVQKAIKTIYMENGFTCTFAEDGAPVDGMIHVIGTVRHVDGHSETFHRYAPADTAGPGGKANKTELQGSQSTVSFLQRKLLCAIWGVTVADDDKDGNALMREYVSKKQITELQRLAKEVDADISQFVCYMLDLDMDNTPADQCTLDKLPASFYDNAIKALEKKRDVLRKAK